MTTAYSSVAALLFLLCALVQTNDPDPAFWIAAYLTGGLGLALLPRLLDSALIAPVIALWLAALVALAAHLALALQLRFRHADPSSDSLLWQLLEHELGRELGGTLALILHAVILLILHNNNNTGSSRYIALSLGAALLLAVAFAWFQFQPAMVARYSSEAPHCSGALSSSSSQQ